MDLLNWSSTSFDDLPDGLVTDILSRLPVKTLVQSTSVSKIWYSIIKSPSFIPVHFSRSIEDPSKYYIVLVHTTLPSMTVVSDNHLLTCNPDLIFRFETETKTQLVVGTCNGLICLTDSAGEYYGHDIYVFNPFIQKHKKLDVESSCYVDLIAQINYITGNIQVGFGYCEDENDYKVVRILNHYSQDYISVRTTKVEIYSMKSRTWKAIDASFEIPPDSWSVFMNGCLYWCLCELEDDRLLPGGHVLCFDLKDEVFSKIKLSTVFFEVHCTSEPMYLAKKPCILDKNGSLAVAIYTKDIDNDYSLKICLLVLEKDIGGDVEWKENYYECTMDFRNPMICVGFSVCGRLIFSVEWGPPWSIVAIDLDNSCAIEKLTMDVTGFSAVLNVVESLVLFLD